jgi:hypothetical protein
MSQLLLRTSQCIFLGGHGDSRDFPTSFTALLASNLLAQFSRQIVIQIFSSESKKFVGISQCVHFRLLSFETTPQVTKTRCQLSLENVVDEHHISMARTTVLHQLW